MWRAWLKRGFSPPYERIANLRGVAGARTAMIVCEHRLQSFNARGDDKELDRFAEGLDELFEAGWLLVDSKRDSGHRGWWCVELFRARALEMDGASLSV